jgi:hypothetical protein
MNLPEISRLGAVLTPSTAAPLNRAWQVGQILQAAVVERHEDGALRLRIGNTVVDARSTLPLATGQTLTVQVTHSGEQAILRLVQTPDQDPRLTQAWRDLLPKQLELKEALPDLARATRQAFGAESKTLPAALRAALQDLARALPSTQELARPDTLKQALANSGLFLENKLAQAVLTNEPPALTRDLKAQLTRVTHELASQTVSAPTSGRAPVADTLPPDLKQLATTAEGSLARMQVNQLASLPPETPAAPIAINVELPVRHGTALSSLGVHIEQEAGDDTARARAFSVWLSLDLPNVGRVEARVRLVGENVSVNFFAEQPATADLFRDHLPLLQRGIEAEGLQAGPLHCDAGVPPTPFAGPRPSGLLDERA